MLTRRRHKSLVGALILLLTCQLTLLHLQCSCPVQRLGCFPWEGRGERVRVCVCVSVCVRACVCFKPCNRRWIQSASSGHCRCRRTLCSSVPWSHQALRVPLSIPTRSESRFSAAPPPHPAHNVSIVPMLFFWGSGRDLNIIKAEAGL